MSDEGEQSAQVGIRSWSIIVNPTAVRNGDAMVLRKAVPSHAGSAPSTSPAFIADCLGMVRQGSLQPRSPTC
jgi:hypothetical protein